MIRKFRWPLLALFLIVVGLWPAAAVPVALALDGAATLIGLISGQVLALAAAAVWLKHRPAPARAA